MAQYSFATVRDDYARLWAAMSVTKKSAANAQARLVIQNRARYEAVEATTKVPWFAVGCMHMRESNGNFGTWLHNGDPMFDRNGNPRRTVQVPKGRPLDPNVTWEEGAYDALVTIEHFDQIRDWNPERVAFALETFNGWGYRSPSRNIPSPYLWGGTSVQKRGKFVADGVYDPNEMDSQLGGMAVLKAIMELCPDARFKSSPAKPAPKVPAGASVPGVSPKATDSADDIRPVGRSRTIWGGLLGYGSTVMSLLFGFFDRLTNPYTLAAFLILLALASVGAFMVVRGYIDVRKLVAHITPDTSEDDS